jgi:glucose-6-phosphate isomerase
MTGQENFSWFLTLKSGLIHGFIPGHLRGNLSAFMNFSKQQLWERFKKYYTEFPTLGLALDLSRMNFDDSFFSQMQPRLQTACEAMAQLEKGAIANPDEQRMVGHYWLRNPALAPTSEIRSEIEGTVAAILEFAGQVHGGSVRGAKGTFKNILLIGIGGSALGPQFVSNALRNPATDKMRLVTFDNTDPDGMDRALAEIGSGLGETLCLVVSKSGGTKETRNGMLEAKWAYERVGLAFERHAVAITQAGSELDKVAAGDKWIRAFPMWDWVGGRTSELSAVGLLPAALQGFDIVALLSGAKACDEITRARDVKSNPAAQMALMWFSSGNGTGSKSMVILPYKDRLELFSKYLQQLVMESLGKERDLSGNKVNQGLTVFGNKGSTDQHAYVQQLRDGLNNFFVTFIEVLLDREGPSHAVEPCTTSGDFLAGFYLGTRQALFEKERESLTVVVNSISAFSVGVLIALFERAVGLYASMINVNAYHQPGVEAGKKAAAGIVQLKVRIANLLLESRTAPLSVLEIARKLEAEDELEIIFKVCEHLAANPSSSIQKVLGSSPFENRYHGV